MERTAFQNVPSSPPEASGDRPPVSSTVSMAVLLAGGLTLSPLSAACGRSALDLHLDDDLTVLQLWADRIGALASAGLAGGAMRVVTQDRGWTPETPVSSAGLEVRVLLEPQRYRGPAGVARDVCAGLGPNELILLAEAARLPDVDLANMIRQHIDRDAEATVGINADRSPAGIYLLRRSALDLVPAIGFMDLKEQWLARMIAAGTHVRVHRFDADGMEPLRTREQFLAASRRIRLARTAENPDGDVRGFVSRTAVVGPGAVIRGSAVLPGAVVEDNATVVRSIVLPGARVRAGASAVDAVIARGGRR